MTISATHRKLVRERARGRCEYCLLPDSRVVTPFQVEHVVPKCHGGRNDLDNLAYSCLRCNLNKGPNLAGFDPLAGKVTRLFHPRTQRWSRHFLLQGCIVVGRTRVGRTTVNVLVMNDHERLALRQELLDQGIM